MAQISERDKDIFRFLSSGPATIEQINAYLTKIGRGKQFSKTTTKDSFPTREQKLAYLYLRLNRLIKAGYVKSKRYNNRSGSGGYALYALTSRSIAVLTEMGHMAEMVRHNLPQPFFVTHELAVTDIVRMIKKESYNRGFELVFLDENILKTTSKENKKKANYPDLLLKMRKKEIYKEVAIELDNGTIVVADIVKKLKDTKTVTVVLCMVQKRIDAIRAGFLSRGIETTPVCFGLLSDFLKTGLFGTEFITIKNSKAFITWKPKADS